jgi:asparagine synthase (glutamine-hydrolysing)
LRRALYLEDELTTLLDESWLNEGLERLSTIAALSTTLRRLSQLSDHAQIAVLESTWYMRNQLLRDTDWSSMSHGLEVRVPFVDASLLESVGPAIASSSPPTKQDLAACAAALPPYSHARPKTGFSVPVREWIGQHAGVSGRGLRGWANMVHQAFRVGRDASPAHVLPFAAE